MGVRVRLTRNSSAHIPFLIAIPVGLYLLIVKVILIIVIGIARLIAWVVKKVRSIDRHRISTVWKDCPTVPRRGNHRKDRRH